MGLAKWNKSLCRWRGWSKRWRREREDGDRKVERSLEIYGRLLWSTDWITEGETRWIIHEDTRPCVCVCVCDMWVTHTHIFRTPLGQLSYEEKEKTSHPQPVDVLNYSWKMDRGSGTAVRSADKMRSLTQLWRHVNNIALFPQHLVI